MNSLAARRKIDLNLPLSSEYDDPSCNLELSLSIPGSFGSADVCHSTGGRRSKEEESGKLQDQLNQMWIHYNGNICVCDATEVQARAIMHHAAAAREADERQRSTSPRPVTPSLPPQLQRSTEMAMRGSLQRFLEKRRARIQSMKKSPYKKQSTVTECQ